MSSVEILLCQKIINATLSKSSQSCAPLRTTGLHLHDYNECLSKKNYCLLLCSPVFLAITYKALFFPGSCCKLSDYSPIKINCLRHLPFHGSPHNYLHWFQLPVQRYSLHDNVYQHTFLTWMLRWPSPYISLHFQE